MKWKRYRKLIFCLGVSSHIILIHDVLQDIHAFKHSGMVATKALRLQAETYLLTLHNWEANAPGIQRKVTSICSSLLYNLKGRPFITGQSVTDRTLRKPAASRQAIHLLVLTADDIRRANRPTDVASVALAGICPTGIHQRCLDMAELHRPVSRTQQGPTGEIA